jgi:hypothetical protein
MQHGPVADAITRGGIGSVENGFQSRTPWHGTR